MLPLALSSSEELLGQEALSASLTRANPEVPRVLDSVALLLWGQLTGKTAAGHSLSQVASVSLRENITSPRGKEQTPRKWLRGRGQVPQAFTSSIFSAPPAVISMSEQHWAGKPALRKE